VFTDLFVMVNRASPHHSLRFPPVFSELDMPEKKLSTPSAARHAGIRFVVFDWDGTLMNSETQIVSCLHAALADLDLEPMGDDALKNVIGLGLREAIDTLVPGRSEHFHARFVERYRYHWFNSEDSSLFEGVLETLDALREHGLLLGVATGKARRGLNRVLEKTGTSGHFEATRCADEAPSKPHPQMLTDLMTELGLTPEQTIMVGDTEYDMEMATQAGTGKVAVSCGVHSVERLIRHNPMTCLEQVSDMPAWLKKAGIIPG
jgi:phosphoglycolate phosphatase